MPQSLGAYINDVTFSSLDSYDWSFTINLGHILEDAPHSASLMVFVTNLDILHLLYFDLYSFEKYPFKAIKVTYSLG